MANDRNRNAHLGIIAIILFVAVVSYTRIVYYAGLFQSDLGPDLRVHDTTLFGTTCEYAIGQLDADFEAIVTRHHEFIKQPMPLAWYLPIQQRPRIDGNQYIITRCHPDLSVLRADREAWVGLGRIWGETSVYLNGIQKAYVTDSGDVVFPILPAERNAKSEIVTLSKLNAHSDGVAGFRGGKPLFITDSRRALSRISVLNDVEHGYSPAYWVNVYIVLALLAGLAWIFGIRYADVTWFMMTVTLYALYWSIAFTPSGAVQPWQRTALFITGFAASASTGFFAWTFVRLPRPKLVLEGIFAFLIGTYAVSYMVQDSSSYLRMMLRYVPFWIIILIFVPTIAVGFISSRNILDHKRRKRVRLFLISCAVYVVTHSWLATGLVTYELAFSEAATELLLLVFSSFFVADLVVFHRRFLEENALRVAVERENERAITLFAVTQMIAHDVRRPFSIIKAGLSMLQSSEDISKTSSNILRRTSDAVDGALDTVNDMLGDFTALGATGELTFEDIEVNSMLDFCLREVFQTNGDCKIKFEFKLAHTGTLLVDAAKVRRAVTNIIENGNQAMGKSGLIWFATRDVNLSDRSFIDLDIGNTGSFIPPEILNQIFEAFYTKGKKGGTGLGLAITRKVARDHGGDITCTSDLEYGTCFTIRLPSSRRYLATGQGEIRLPQCSQDMLLNPSTSHEKIIQPISLIKESWNCEKIRLLAVDDEALYRLHVIDLVMRDHDLCDKVIVSVAATSNEALAQVQLGVDIALIDIKMNTVTDGFNLASKVQDICPEAMVCILSNAEISQAQESPWTTIAKPITLRHIHELVGDYCREPVRARIAVIEDNTFIVDAWLDVLRGNQVETFGAPEEFFAWVNQDQTNLSSLTVVVTDFYFQNSNLTGIEVATHLRTNGFGGSVILSTDRGSGGFEKALFDKVTGKDPIPLDQLLK